jgi:hypothetical protein
MHSSTTGCVSELQALVASIISPFTTVDLKRMRDGRYDNQSGRSSDNVAFGRLLSAHRVTLRIEKVSADQRAHDDNGTATTSALWRRVDENDDE